jgi:hypothetical protein
MERAGSPYEIPPAPQMNSVRDAPIRKTARSKRFPTNPRSRDASIWQFSEAEFVRPVVDFFLFIFLVKVEPLSQPGYRPYGILNLPEISKTGGRRYQGGLLRTKGQIVELFLRSEKQFQTLHGQVPFCQASL